MIVNTENFKMKTVTEKALLSRINRKLAHQGERLKKLRGERWYTGLGYYFVVDLYLNAVRDTHINLEGFAREIGVLNDSEKLAEAV